MYTPSAYRVDDHDAVLNFIDRHPFATLISPSAITHAPLYRFGDGQLYGHVAAANPQAHEADNCQVTAVFSGPHAYISPTMYATDFNVPTWNYSAVHSTGTMTYIDDSEEAWDVLQKMVHKSEGADGWRLPDEPRYRALLKGIRCFRITNISHEATFKWNQNKKTEDIAAVLATLHQQNPEAATTMQATRNNQPT